MGDSQKINKTTRRVHASLENEKLDTAELHTNELADIGTTLAVSFDGVGVKLKNTSHRND